MRPGPIRSTQHTEGVLTKEGSGKLGNLNRCCRRKRGCPRASSKKLLGGRKEERVRTRLLEILNHPRHIPTGPRLAKRKGEFPEGGRGRHFIVISPPYTLPFSRHQSRNLKAFPCSLNHIMVAGAEKKPGGRLAAE